MGHYLDNEYLERLIHEGPDEELGKVLYLFVSETVKWWDWSNANIEQEDAAQECWIACMRACRLGKVKAGRGKPFNYLTTISLNCLRQLYRSSLNFATLKNNFRAHLEAKYRGQKFGDLPGDSYQPKKKA